MINQLRNVEKFLVCAWSAEIGCRRRPTRSAHPGQAKSAVCARVLCLPLPLQPKERLKTPGSRDAAYDPHERSEGVPLPAPLAASASILTQLPDCRPGHSTRAMVRLACWRRCRRDAQRKARETWASMPAPAEVREQQQQQPCAARLEPAAWKRGAATEQSSRHRRPG